MPAHRGFPQVGGRSFVPFWHKNTPGGCSVFYAVYSGGRIASAARQRPEADTVLLKKHFLALLLRRAAALPGDELVRHDDLCGQKVRVLDVVDGQAERIIALLGGRENIVLVDACMTRLRVTVKDPAKVADLAAWKAEGALSLLVKGDGIQAVYGPKADVLKSDINDIL